jgi:hypothetical protein
VEINLLGALGRQGWESFSWPHEYGKTRGVPTNFLIVPRFSLPTNDMNDSPGANTTPPPTELSSLRQLSEDAERNNDDLFPTAPDTEVAVGEADQNLPRS